MVSCNKTQSTTSSQDATITFNSEITKLVTAAGSAETVIARLLKERQSQKAQNAQLWRLVDKQRAMILGLNTDLERSVKEKERYRRRIKEVAKRINYSPTNANLNLSSHHSDEHTDSSSSCADLMPTKRRSTVDVMMMMMEENEQHQGEQIEEKDNKGEGELVVVLEEKVQLNSLAVKNSEGESVSPIELFVAPHPASPDFDQCKDQNLKFFVEAENKIPSPSNGTYDDFSSDPARPEAERRIRDAELKNPQSLGLVTKNSDTKKNMNGSLTHPDEPDEPDRHNNLINLTDQEETLPIFTDSIITGQENEADKKINKDYGHQNDASKRVSNLMGQNDTLNNINDLYNDSQGGTHQLPKTESDGDNIYEPNKLSTDQSKYSQSKSHCFIPASDGNPTISSYPSIESLNKIDTFNISQTHKPPFVPRRVKGKFPICLDFIPQPYSDSLYFNSGQTKGRPQSSRNSTSKPAFSDLSPILLPERFSGPSNLGLNLQKQFSGRPPSPNSVKDGTPTVMSRPQSSGLPPNPHPRKPSSSNILSTNSQPYSDLPLSPYQQKDGAPSTPTVMSRPQSSGLPPSPHPRKPSSSNILSTNSQPYSDLPLSPYQQKDSAPSTPTVMSRPQSSGLPPCPYLRKYDATYIPNTNSQAHLGPSLASHTQKDGVSSTPSISTDSYSDLSMSPHSYKDSISSTTIYHNQLHPINSPPLSPTLANTQDKLLSSLMSPTELREQALALPSPPISIKSITGRGNQLDQLNLTTPKPLVIVKKDQSSSSSSEVESMPVVAQVSALPEKDLSDINQCFVSEEYPGLILSPDAVEKVNIKTASRLRPLRGTMSSKNEEEELVWTLTLIDRSTGRDMWQVEKDPTSIVLLDQILKRDPSYSAKFPDKLHFSERSPAKVEAWRLSLNNYLVNILATKLDATSTLEICKYFSSDILENRLKDSILNSVNKKNEFFSIKNSSKSNPLKDGYLTKRGKNFGGWKARYFVLDGPVLQYYESPGGPYLGAIKLVEAKIGKQSPNSEKRSSTQSHGLEADSQYRHAFLISELRRKDSSSRVHHVLCAQNDLERDQWVDALCHFIGSNKISKEKDNLSEKRHQRQQSFIYNKDKKAVHRSHPSNSNSDKNSNNTKKVKSQSQTHKNQIIQGLVEFTLPAATRFKSPEDLESEAFESTHSSEASIGNLGASNKSPLFLSRPPLKNSTPNDTLVNQFSSAESLTAQKLPDEKAKQRKRSFFGLKPKSKTYFSTTDLPSSNFTDDLSLAINNQSHRFQSAFGAPLDQAVKYNSPSDANVELPAVVYRCIEYLHAKDASIEEGIFRLSGSNLVIRQLRQRFITEGDVNLVLDDQYYDIHAVASLLKLYLRELPTTILTKKLHPEFMAVTNLPGLKEKISALKQLVSRLPSVNQSLLRYLASFLINIISHSDINKMNIRNVGIVFSPTLNIPGAVFSLLLQQYEEIFNEDPDNRRGIVLESKVFDKKNIIHSSPRSHRRETNNKDSKSNSLTLY